MEGDRAKGLVSELKANVLELKQALVLLDDRVLWTGEDFNERELIEILEHANHRQASDKFGDETKLDEIFRLNILQKLLRLLFGTNCFFFLSVFTTPETKRFLADTALDDLLESNKGSAADKENVRGVNRREFLVWMLAPPLRRNISNRAFQNLQQGLLHAFA